MTTTREQFLLEEVISRFPRNQINKAVEVGVGDGNFSAFLCNTTPVREFYGVDPYLKYEDYIDIPERASDFYNTQEGLDALYDLTTYVYECYENATLIRKTSVEAALDFDDESIDLVYIDANHEYEYVKQDLEAWWPKIVQGGVLCGDDYEEAGAIPFGVIQAVDEFALTNNLTVRVGDCWWKQWWIVKE